MYLVTKTVYLKMMKMNRYELKDDIIIDNEGMYGDRNSLIDIEDKKLLIKKMNIEDKKQKEKIKYLEKKNEKLTTEFVAVSNLCRFLMSFVLGVIDE